MSDKRDFIRLTMAVATSINAGVSKPFSFDASTRALTSATVPGYVKMGPLLSNAHNCMHGRIEQVSVYINNATCLAGSPLSIGFYYTTNFDAATPTTDPYIDHEDFAKGSYLINNAAKPGRNSSTVQIPYFNLTNDQKIHIAIKNASASTNIPKDVLRVDVTFRPDLGE